MRIVMAGASGFLGTRLRERLNREGHELIMLVRREPTGKGEHRWWPERRELDASCLVGTDAVINLAGAGVGDKRWTTRYRQTLWSSRVDPTHTLATALAALGRDDRPATLLNASAVGFYGDTGDDAVDESSPAGAGFLADLCRSWEGASGPAEAADVRVVDLRTGFPLDRDGGLLKPLILQFQLLAGGRLGTGRQWVPWISMADWLSAMTFLLASADIAGPVNLVGPQPARNADFAAALGRALHRPALVPAPGFALRLVLGEFGQEALASQRVLPGVLNRSGFRFAHADLDSALASALHRSTKH